MASAFSGMSRAEQQMVYVRLGVPPANLPAAPVPKAPKRKGNEAEPSAYPA